MSTGGPDGSCSAWTLGNNNGRKRNSTEGDEDIPFSGFDITSNSSQGPPAMQTSSIATPLFAYPYQQLPSVLPPQQQQQIIHAQSLQQVQRPPPFHHQQPLHSPIQRLPHSRSNRHVVPQETHELHQQVLHQQLLFHQQRQPHRGTRSGATSSDSMEIESHRFVPRSTTSGIAGPVTAPSASSFDTDQSRAVVTFTQDVPQPQGIFPHATVVQQSAMPPTSILGSFPQQHAASQAASYSHHSPQHFLQSSQSYPASPMTPFAPIPPFDRRLSATSMLPPSASPTPSSSSSKSSTSLQQQQQQPSSSGHPVSSESQSLAPTGFKTTSTSPSEKGLIRNVPLSVAPDRSFSTEGDHMKLTDITRDNALAKEFLKSFRLRNERSNEGEAACDFCRKRKIRCDREKPSCSTCKERGVECKKSDVLRKRGPPTKAERAKLAEAGFKYNSEERRSRSIRGREESVASSSSTPGVNSNPGSSSQSKAADVFGSTASSPSSASSLSSFTPLTGIRTNDVQPGGTGPAGALSAELTQTSHSSSPSLLSFDSQFLSLVSPTSLTPSASSTGSLASWVATPHQVGLDRRDIHVSEQNLNAYLSHLHHQQVREDDRDARNNRFGSARGE